MDRTSAFAIHLSLALLLTACLAGCLDEGEDDEDGDDLGDWVYAIELDTQNVTGNTTLRVENINGDVEVSTWYGTQVDLHVEKKVRKMWEGELDNAEVNVTLVADELLVRTVYQTLAAHNVTTSLTLLVPIDLNITLLKTINGNVEATGLVDDLALRSTNGNLVADNVQGFVAAATTNGDIDILNVSGIADLTTLNGNVDARVKAIADNVTISAVNGNVEAWFPDTLNANLTLTVATGLIDLHDLAVNLTTDGEKHKEGRLGDGGYQIDISSSTGDLELHQLCDKSACASG